MLQGVAGSLVSGGDVPRMGADRRSDGRIPDLALRGRGLQGTHWVVSAYQMGRDQTVYVAVRSEIRAAGRSPPCRAHLQET